MTITIIRQLLLFAHTLAFAFALVTVVRQDLSFFKSSQLDLNQLKSTSRSVTLWLVLLWLTGLSLIALDCGLNPAVLATKPKLAAKLTVVGLLTLNGILLHQIAFPMLGRPQHRPKRASFMCTLMGAVSGVTWLYATFVGVARLIAPSMNYQGFLLLYALSLMLGFIVTFAFVRPKVEKMLLHHPAPQL